MRSGKRGRGIRGIDTNNSLYYNQELWLAAPSDTGSCLWCVRDEIIGKNTLADGAKFRPIVCLNTDVELQKQADGSYKIVE